MSSHFEKYYYTPFEPVLGVFLYDIRLIKTEMNAIHIHMCTVYVILLAFWTLKSVSFHFMSIPQHPYAPQLFKRCPERREIYANHQTIIG